MALQIPEKPFRPASPPAIPAWGVTPKAAAPKQEPPRDSDFPSLSGSSVTQAASQPIQPKPLRPASSSQETSSAKPAISNSRYALEAPCNSDGREEQTYEDVSVDSRFQLLERGHTDSSLPICLSRLENLLYGEPCCEHMKLQEEAATPASNPPARGGLS